MFVISGVWIGSTSRSLAPHMAREFHLDDLQLGWVFSALVIGYARFHVVGTVWFVIARKGSEEHTWVSEREAEWIAQGIGTRPKESRFPWRIMLPMRMF